MPGWMYARLLTTHATFLCRERARGEKKLGAAPNASGKEAH